MNSTLIKAIRVALEKWETLDDNHKGKQYEISRGNLEKWLKELEVSEQQLKS